MGFGRVVCVAVPFLLTLGSLAALLVAGLAGIANKDLYMFQVNTTDLSISPASIESLIQSVSSRGLKFHDASLLDGSNDEADSGISGIKTDNITAGDLGLYDLYDVTLWGYCYQPHGGDRACTKPAFNWAETAMNQSANNLTTMVASTGQTIKLPKEITDAMKAFGTIAKWTEIVFIIAYICLAVELFFGLFASCSRALSCVTWIVAGLASAAVCASAALATTMSVVVVGAVEGTAKWYGVSADFNTRFLAAVWIAAVFALAAGFFWLFTICCCAPDHSSHRSGGRKRHLDNGGEKFMPAGAYAPLHDPSHASVYGYPAQQQGVHYATPQYPHPAPRSDMAYEPYSHANV